MSPLRFVLDENLRGVLLLAIHRRNAVRPDEVIDVSQVGDPDDLLRGTPDVDLLGWAEREDRLVVSWDKKTLPGHLRDHLAAGRRCPGILIIPRDPPIGPLIDRLVLIAHASLPGEFADRVTHVKL